MTKNSNDHPHLEGPAQNAWLASLPIAFAIASDPFAWWTIPALVAYSVCVWEGYSKSCEINGVSKIEGLRPSLSTHWFSKVFLPMVFVASLLGFAVFIATEQ